MIYEEIKCRAETETVHAMAFVDPAKSQKVKNGKEKKTVRSLVLKSLSIGVLFLKLSSFFFPMKFMEFCNTRKTKERNSEFHKLYLIFWDLENKIYSIYVSLVTKNLPSSLYSFSFYRLVTSNCLSSIVSLVFVTQIHMYGRIRSLLYVRRPFNSLDTDAVKTVKWLDQLFLFTL